MTVPAFEPCSDNGSTLASSDVTTTSTSRTSCGSMSVGVFPVMSTPTSARA